MPKLAVGDGALGFWAAAAEVFPLTRRQRCWVHKTANMLDKLPNVRIWVQKAPVFNIFELATESRVGLPS